MAEEKSDAYYIAVGQPTNGKLQKTADESIQHTTDHVITQTAADTARQMNDETTKQANNDDMQQTTTVIETPGKSRSLDSKLKSDDHKRRYNRSELGPSRFFQFKSSRKSAFLISSQVTSQWIIVYPSHKYLT